MNKKGVFNIIIFFSLYNNIIMCQASHYLFDFSD